MRFLKPLSDAEPSIHRLVPFSWAPLVTKMAPLNEVPYYLKNRPLAEPVGWQHYHLCLIHSYGPTAVRVVYHDSFQLVESEFLLRDFLDITIPCVDADVATAARQITNLHLSKLQLAGRAHLTLGEIIFNEELRMAKKAPDVKSKPVEPKSFEPYVAVTRQRNTCIVVTQDETLVRYIPLDIAGFSVVKSDPSRFKEDWSPLTDYPVERAARLYIGYAQNNGATDEALRHLARISNATEQELTMATKKAAEAAKKKPVSTAKGKVADKKAAAKKEGKPAKAGGPEKGANWKQGESAASMFKDLIMEGKLNDDQIFKKVQAKFGLDESRRSYVGWYRNSLKKAGLNPPEAK